MKTVAIVCVPWEEKLQHISRMNKYCRAIRYGRIKQSN
jgi:hypothetical protein